MTPALRSPRHIGGLLTAFSALQATLAAAFLSLAQAAPAQPVPVPAASSATEPAPPSPPHGLSGGMGLGVATVPTYEGSARRRTVAVPELSLLYRSRSWGTVELGQRGLNWQAFEAGAFSFGLVALVDAGRKTKDPAAIDPAPGDKRLAGLGAIRPSLEAGVGIGAGPLTLIARHAVGDRGHGGAQADLMLDVPLLTSDRFNLRLSTGATWADRDYMQAYFGVTAAQSRATSFAQFTAHSGWRKFDAGAAAEYSMTSDWKLRASLGASRLAADAAASPLVARRNSSSLGVGVVHAF